MLLIANSTQRDTTQELIAHLDPIEPRLPAPIRTLPPTLHHLPDLLHRHRPRPPKLIPRPLDLQLHIARAHRIRIQRARPLSPGVAQLRDKQTAVFLRGGRDFGEGSDAAVVVVDDDRIAEGLDGVVAHHRVAGDDDADVAFAPAAVQV